MVEWVLKVVFPFLNSFFILSNIVKLIVDLMEYFVFL